ncbi:MAG TPA: hypothetical protein VG605_14720 [Puia sp.]|nr:hypothetical protein [Puia sp.]
MNLKLFFWVTCIQVLGGPARSQNQMDTGKISVFERQIPKLKNGQAPAYYRNKAPIENMMGLRSLEKGFDSLQIRIWYGYARTDTGQLFIFSRKDGKWSAELYNFVYLMSANKRIKGIAKKVSAGLPRQGWPRFSEKLFSFMVTTIPDQGEIDNYPDFTDGDAVIIEVATKDSYRIFSYKEPKLAQSQIKEAKNIEKVLTLIDDQFSFKRLRIF